MAPRRRPRKTHPPTTGLVGNADQRRKQAEFLHLVSQNGNVTISAERVGMNRGSHYGWMQHDPTYPDRFHEACTQAIERMEEEARRRGQEGVDEPVIHQGLPTTYTDPVTGREKIFTVKKYSDNLLMFLLKGLKPEKYRERFEHSGPGGGPLQVQTLLAHAEVQFDSRMARLVAQQGQRSVSGNGDRRRKGAAGV